MVLNQDCIKQINQKRDQLNSSIVDIARRNLTYSDEVQSLGRSVMETIDTVSKQESQLQQLNTTYNKLRNTYSLDEYLRALSRGIDDVEQQSAGCRQQFAGESGALSVGGGPDGQDAAQNASGGGGSSASGDLVSRYLKLRKLYHVRSAKRERLIDVFGPRT